MRSTITVCLTLMIILGVSAVASAAMPEMPKEIVVKCEKEAPLNQKDVDAFIKMWPEIMKGGDKSEAEAKKFFAGHGFTEVRATFVIMKINNARMMTEAVKATGDKAMATQLLLGMGMPKVFLPSDAESALVEKNAARLNALEGFS